MSSLPTLEPQATPSRRSRGGHRGTNNRSNNGRAQNATPKRSRDNEEPDTKVTPHSQNTTSRRGKFGAQLSAKTTNEADITGNIDVSKTISSSRRLPKPSVDVPDLTARLTHSLTVPPYSECVICFSAIHPQQPTWSCTPSEETNRCCYGVFHNKCIYAWAKKNIQETKAAFQARNEDRDGEWRCPGCQTHRVTPPGPYKCFCGAVVDPKPGRLATPHSCGMTCQRPRLLCEHPCPLSCHPGPCPPCSALVSVPCHSGHKNLSLRCSRMTSTADESVLSCGEECRRPICEKHTCKRLCHAGECEPCQEIEQATCYCGKSSQLLACKNGKSHSCDDGANTWEGRFSCQDVCERPYSCGKHSCKEICHPHLRTDSLCPRDPAKIQTCPCGKKPMAEFETQRTSCSDKIPTCEQQCGKQLPDCDHPCAKTCHTGPCPPCQNEVVLPCRCGETIRRAPCFQQSFTENKGFLCTKICRSLRNCGKHVCNRPCCPLSHLNMGKGKGKKAKNDVVDESEWHECDLTCSKVLNCGLHRCERKDHKGLCPPCLQSSFDEMTCVCGRTTLMPPVPCGTQIHCNYPCSRPPPPCGHPRTAHSCHETEGCPPCPFLTPKPCACGKKILPNVRCSQDKVSCGTPCGKTVSCGFHACERLCHTGECGPCQSVCGKDRKLCLPHHHPCTSPCHAPSACPEDDACSATIILKCPCGRIQRPVACGKSASNTGGASRNLSSLQPKCNADCQISQRNARLAEALGIDQSSATRNERSAATYTAELTSFGRANLGFVKTVEAALADFVSSTRSTHALPHMPELKRNFVYNLCKVYRIDTRMIDVEPQRSVELIRRIDTRLPQPLLSSVITQSAGSSTGKLLLNPGTVSPKPPPAKLPASTPSTPRAWASVASVTSVNRGTPPMRPSPRLPNPTTENIPSDWDIDD